MKNIISDILGNAEICHFPAIFVGINKCLFRCRSVEKHRTRMKNVMRKFSDFQSTSETLLRICSISRTEIFNILRCIVGPRTESNLLNNYRNV